MNERKKIYLFWYNASMKLSNLVASSCSSSTSGVMLISDNASSDDDVVVVLNVSSSVYSSTLVPAPLLCCCCFLPAQTDHLVVQSSIQNTKEKTWHIVILIISISMFFLSLFTFITVNQHTNRDTHRDTETQRERGLTFAHFCS